MINAIVFESNTGYTQEYACLLSSRTSLPAYCRQEAKQKLSKGESILYLGWICAGGVKGYSQAAKRYAIQALCAVGMSPPTEKTIQEITHRHNVRNIPVFCLQGGYDRTKLHGIYRFLMGVMEKTLIAGLESNPGRNEAETKMLEMLRQGGSAVAESSLFPVYRFLDSGNVSDTEQAR